MKSANKHTFIIQTGPENSLILYLYRNNTHFISTKPTPKKIQSEIQRKNKFNIQFTLHH
ncbi:hypothetical protein SAMN05421877_10580 [Sphingobacterium lactis]|uniref:Uncharacterized protein n=1 Tax=Sphingobacterium lactis TaxID=797291 RepID=A0A1H5XQ06_9SPHI|nr:hypothetical protein SAMN05421877_10580 [Sphingobacterium lactis]